MVQLTENRKWIALVTMCALLLSSSLIAVAESRSIRRDNDNSTSRFVTEFLRGIRSTPDGASYEIFEGDILMPKVQNGLQSSAIGDSNKKWVDAKIPYVIANDYTGEERKLIIRAMNLFHENTCIRFVDRSNELDYIIIQKSGKGCNSFVGRIGGSQRVSLDEGCLDEGTVQHELMHAAGFWHEQSRTDRDDYVTIHWDNIIPGTKSNFHKYDKTTIQLLRTPYDTESIMHYQSDAFALNKDMPTITKKDGSRIDENKVFTKTDILDLNRLYNCNADDCWDNDECKNQLSFDWQDGDNGQVKWAFNCDFTGFDIAKQVSSGELCGSLCINNPSCTHFTWGWESHCFMKSAHNPPASKLELEGAVCGWVVRRNSAFHWQDGDNGLVTWASGCDFFGNDIGKKKSSGEECGKICINNPSCTHFTWGWDSYCFLKSAVKPTAWPMTTEGVCGWVNSRV